MAHQFSAASIITPESYPALLNKAIDVLWMRRDEIAGQVLGQFFDVETKQSGLTHVMTSVGSALRLPQENDDLAPLPYLTPADGFSKTFALVNYRSGIRVTDTIMRADRFDKVVQMCGGQIKSGQRKDEYLRAAIFNGAFSGTDGADSLSLCYDSHPHENNDAGTWDNLGTGSLTGPNIQALRLVGQKMTNEQGDPDPVMGMVLLVPTDLEQKALELTRSTGKPEGMLNDPNVLIGGLKVVVSPFLTSATAYFLVGDRDGYNKGLHEVVLEPWNIKDNKPANADIVLDKRIKAIKTFGFTTSKNVIGSAG